MADSHIKQDALKAAIWKACGAQPRAVDPNLHRDYCLTLFFLKFLSDAWRDHLDGSDVRWGSLTEPLRKSGLPMLPPTADFYALHEARGQAGNAERLAKALHDLEEANSGALGGVFQGISFNADALGEQAQNNELLGHLLEAFGKPELCLRPSRLGSLDIIGNAFDFLINKFASIGGKTTGAYCTPPEVSRLIALLTDLREGDEICDPICGSGSILLACGHYVRQQHGSSKYALYGQVAKGRTRALAKMNLLLHREDSYRIEPGDSLQNPNLLDEAGLLKKFDVVVADLSFPSKTWGQESAASDPFRRFHWGIPPRAKGDYAYILHMIASMKRLHGRMAVIVRHGVLFRGAAEGRIRQNLINENLLDVVIGLPEKLLYGTGIPSAILVFRSNKTDDNVLFIDGSHGYQDGKHQNLLREPDLKKILDACSARVQVDGFAYLATREQIAEHGYNLNIHRYVDAKEEVKESDLLSVGAEREMFKTELTVLEHLISGYFKELGYG